MKPKILVLEDDENLRGTITDILEDDYACVDKGTPEEAIEAARYTQFDLLIADVRMPSKKDASGRPLNARGVEMDGIDSAGEIRQLHPGIYYILITGHTDLDAPSRAMSHGMDYWLPKPFNATKLLNVVRSVLETKESHNTHQGQLAGFARSSKRFLGWIMGQQESQPELSMDQNRLNFHKAYFNSIQGIQTQWKLTSTAALWAWEKLLALEEAYEDLDQIIGEAANSLGQRYKALQTSVEILAAKHSLGDATSFPMRNFAPLYKGICEQKIDFPGYLLAPTVWIFLQRIPPARRPTALQKQAYVLFGIPPAK